MDKKETDILKGFMSVNLKTGEFSELEDRKPKKKISKKPVDTKSETKK